LESEQHRPVPEPDFVATATQVPQPEFRLLRPETEDLVSEWRATEERVLAQVAELHRLELEAARLGIRPELRA
jgi:hypothetical protein